MKQVLMIDNYDSFSQNVVYAFRELGARVRVVANDINLENLDALIKRHNIGHLIISPGPNHPRDSGVCVEAIRHFAPRLKILGICLGHQCIAQAFGGEVSALQSPTHGKSACIHFEPNALFMGVEQGIEVGLYHSLYVSRLGECEGLAWSESGVCMALKAHAYECYGVQFHPESILQQQGKQILKNFLML